MMFGKMGVGALDLNKAFAADRLVAASGAVQVRWVCQETDRTLISVLVEENLKRLSIDERIIG